jgi:hypothetical protein
MPSTSGRRPSNPHTSTRSISSVPCADGTATSASTQGLHAPGQPTALAHLRPSPRATIHQRAVAFYSPASRTHLALNPGFTEPGAPRKEVATHLASLSTPLPPAMQPDLLGATLAATRTWPDFPCLALLAVGSRCSPHLITLGPTSPHAQRSDHPFHRAACIKKQSTLAAR